MPLHKGPQWPLIVLRTKSSSLAQPLFSKMKQSAVLPASMGLFGNKTELQFKTSKRQQKPKASPMNKGEGSYFYGEKDSGEGAVLEESPLEKTELREVVVSGWPSCWGCQVLVGDAMPIISCWGL